MADRITPFRKIALFMILQTILFGGLFSLRLFGLSYERIAILLTITVSFEAIFFIFIQTSANKNVESLKEIEKAIERILDDGAKTHTALIHLGHQMKNIQHDLDILRKNGILKSNGSSHPKVHS